MTRTSTPTKTKGSLRLRAIEIHGARTNTLKNVSCRIPHGKLTVITGPSGSGKSSLAFDTLYAEGQRRYIESMSAYARQFFERIEKPDVDKIEYILPAIALEQKNRIKNARSTVGTATEIYDYLQILYATLGETICDDCGGEVTESNPKQIEARLKKLPEGSKLVLLAPVSLEDYSVQQLLDLGYFRIFRNGEIEDLQPLKYQLLKKDRIDIVMDRMILKHKEAARLRETIRNALALGKGHMQVYDLGTKKTLSFRNEFACIACGKNFTKPHAHFFSFNSPMGACPSCEGFGRIIGLDLDKVIPNKHLSLKQGAVHPFTTPSNQEMRDDLLSEGKKRKIHLDVPYKDLTDKEKTFVINGGGEYWGIRRFFDWLETKRYKMHVRVMLAKYRAYHDCPDCLGSRIRKEALQVFINGKSVWDMTNMPVNDLLDVINALELTPAQEQMIKRVLHEVKNRLEYLVDSGLHYLTLSRQSRTLSGGEAQRINLSTALGCALTDTLYVLDEPTVGLHARDTHRLLGILKSLRDAGNTVAVVEHDPEVICAADHILDMGPAGGEDGGRIVYEGDFAGLLEIPYSLTATCLKQPAEKIRLSSSKKASKEKFIEITGARGNNLQNLSVKIPKNQLVCITGVSGSGKSTLIKQTLYAAYLQDRGQGLDMDWAVYDSITGLEEFKDVVLVDQSPPARSARSNPITFMKAYDEIRQLYAESRKAMALGLKPGDFSFNTPGGRCDTCEGLGYVTIDMQFMADVTVVCQECLGRRFKHNVLTIDINGKNINDVLNMTMDEAAAFFNKTSPKLIKKLKPLQDLGLGYLKLGQPTSTLSGGEAQRLKLASYMQESLKTSEAYLFLFDEPTTGLHMADIQTLTQVFRRLIEQGHSAIVIEHNLDFIVQADHLIDLGPEGGIEGGQIIAQGSLEEIIAAKKSITGQFLKEKIGASCKA